jgi:hypothetical protein
LIFALLWLGLSLLDAAEVPVWTRGHAPTDDLGGKYGVYTSPGCKIDLGLSRGGALEIHYLDRSDGACGVFFHLFGEDTARSRSYVDLARFQWLHVTVQGPLNAEIRLADEALYAQEDSSPAGRLGELAGPPSAGGWREAVIPTARVPLNRREGVLLAISFATGDEGVLRVSRIAFSDSPDPSARPIRASPPDSTNQAEVPRSMWFWEFADCLNDAAVCRRVFAFARQHRITRIFAQISSHCDFALGAECRLDRPDRLREILHEASKQGLRVDALDGAPEFALSEYHDHVLGIVRAVLEFNRQAAADERFGGIHLDIEPYLLLGFSGGSRESILRQYLTLNRRVADLVGTSGAPRIELGADIPFWYDEAEQEGVNPNVVSFEGRTQDVSRHMIDLVDETVLMDYRSSALGPDGIIAHAAGEVQYASSRGKRVAIGVETLPQRPSQSVFLAGLPERQWQALRDNPVLFQREVNGYRMQSVSAGRSRYVGFNARGGVDTGLLDALEQLAGKLGLPVFDTSARNAALSAARSSLSRVYDSFQPIDLPGRAAFSVRSVPLEKISFWGKTRGAMDRALDTVSRRFAKEPGFNGIAIHSFSSYSQMAE